jgi:hypothetical protein
MQLNSLLQEEVISLVGIPEVEKQNPQQKKYQQKLNILWQN